MDHFIAKTVKAPLYIYESFRKSTIFTLSTNKMSDRSQFAILGAFVLGVVLTAAYNQRIAHLKEENKNSSPQWQLRQQQKLISRFAKINDLDTLKSSLSELELSLERKAEDIKEGIEGCIGDTPLIKIKSLSEFTGCEIFAKAEVIKCTILRIILLLSRGFTVSKWRW